jgi:SAM-dependent methyltransferase
MVGGFDNIFPPMLDRRLFNGKVQSAVIYPRFFPLALTDRVVNLGCGLGPQAVVYKNSFARMVGVDLHAERLKDSHTLLAEHGVQRYETVCAPVECTGLPDASFDKALAIDIIEHVPDPAAFLREAHRLLKPGAELLISVPAMHDHYVHTFRAIGRLLGRKTHELPHGHWDAHNSNHAVSAWRRIIAATPFVIVRTRATTLWPPLHLYGVPKFWFTNSLVRAIDDLFCGLPLLKQLGQTYLIVVRKP